MVQFLISSVRSSPRITPFWRRFLSSGGRLPARSSKSQLPESPSMFVFDRNHKRMQRDRAASGPRSDSFDYLKDYVALSLVERLDDLNGREFPIAVGDAFE